MLLVPSAFASGFYQYFSSTSIGLYDGLRQARWLDEKGVDGDIALCRRQAEPTTTLEEFVV